MLIPLRYRRRITLVSVVLGLFLIYHFISIRPNLPRPLSTVRSNLQQQQQPKQKPDTHSDCPLLPGIEDVLVVMKTGVTEALDKVPVHFETTLRCIPNYVIFSDFEEEIAGVRIHDALRNMDPEVKRTVPDFDLYNRLQKLGRKGLGTQDFADEANSAIGKPNNPGWKLDKWKFLPMVRETLRYKNDAKWYVFMEADTYFAWPTLLEWLSNYDPQKPLYIGTETQIADVIFAHGGSGFIISHPALQLAVDEYAARSVELDMFTDEHWAGDCVLGKVLLDAGVPLTYSWPILQNSNIGELDPFTAGFYRQPWCFPAVAFHHLSSQDIRNLWEFEQRRWKVRSLLAIAALNKDEQLLKGFPSRTSASFYTQTSSKSSFTPNSPTSATVGIIFPARNTPPSTHSRNASLHVSMIPPVSNSHFARAPVSPARRLGLVWGTPPCDRAGL